MDSPAHYLLSASGADVWRHCAAAPTLSALYPEPDSDSAREGTAVHEAAAGLVWGTPIPHAASNGVVYTDEMREAAELWAATVQSIRAANPDAVTHVEQKAAATAIHPTQCGGTPDVWLYSASKRRVWVGDLKFGHAFVDVFESLQLIVYLSQIVDALGINGDDEQLHSVEFFIVQPRSYGHGSPVRTWSTRVSDIRPLWNQLRHAAELAMQPNPTATAGAHCYYCAARHACPAAARMAYKAIDYAYRGQPLRITPESVSFELQVLERAADAIKSRLLAIEEQAKQLFKSGKIVPGYGLEQSYGRLAWTQPTDKVKALGDAYGLKLTEEKPITPTQARAKGIDDFVINAYAAKPANGLKLVKQDANAVRRILSNFTE